MKGLVALLAGLAVGAALSEEARLAAFRRPAELVIPAPSQNVLSPARIELGRRLFFDTRLSGPMNRSCASCHDPARDYSDGRARANGMDGRPLDRRTPTVRNLAWCELLFWDGRAASLEEQALSPLQSPHEMDVSERQLLQRLAADPDYPRLFEEAYPGEPVGLQTVTRALASFERSLVGGPSELDRGKLSPAARRGFFLFDGKARCSACHVGWRFTDDGFHDIGLADEDRGRGPLMPGFETMEHAFKTPSLRNVARRAPYMHDGSQPTLRSVIEFYDRGGDARRPGLSEEIRPLGLEAREKDDLEQFLHSLSE